MPHIPALPSHQQHKHQGLNEQAVVLCNMMLAVLRLSASRSLDLLLSQ
jgi:hypothetical protein